jgi:subtilisin family serine protease
MLPSAQDLVGQDRKDDPRIKVAILDTGLDGTHPFLSSAPWKETDVGDRVKGSIWFDKQGQKHVGRPWSVWKKTQRPEEEYLDLHGHGTHCAGLVLEIAQSANIYIARVGGGNQAPDPASIGKVSRSNESTY